MMSLNARFKSAVLVVAMLTASNVAQGISFATVKNVFTAEKMAFGVLVAMWIRLKSKGTNFDYKMSDWADDVKEIMEDYNIFDKELYVKLLAFFDKYAVGRQLSIYDMTIRSKNDEDGTIIAKKDKYLKSKPFGAMGLFDAYVIGMLEGLGKIATNWDNAGKLYGKFDSATVESPAANK